MYKAQCPVYNEGTSLTHVYFFKFMCIIYVTEAEKILCLQIVTVYYSMGSFLFFNTSCKASISLAFYGRMTWFYWKIEMSSS